MSTVINLTDRDFTRLLVIKRVENNKWGGSQWLCLCDCGNIKVVLGGYLTSGDTKSCGCLRREQAQINRQQAWISNRIHGMCHTPEYRALHDAKSRCDDPNNPVYENYGGRGIEFCTRWRGSHGFENFLKDMGKRPGPGYSIERVDNDGNYEPGNCKWATAKEQSVNTRRNKWFKAISPIRRVYTSRNQQEFARDHNLTPCNISSCLHGRQQQHKGWTFTYIDLNQSYKFKRAQHHFNARRNYGEAQT